MYQHDFILIDQSGSMSGKWVEALSSVNVYVRKLAEQDINTGVTVALFDSGYAGQMKFKVVRDRITPKTFRQLSNEDGQPSGGTPLSDATVKIVQMAENGNYEKVSLVIVTDGEENSSTQYSVTEAKAALERCRSRDWAVTMLGADFQNDRQATQYGLSLNNAVFTKAGNFSDTFTTLGLKRGLYAATAVGSAAETTMAWTAEEKNEASK